MTNIIEVESLYGVKKKLNCSRLLRCVLVDLVAQQVEQFPFKEWVLGSSPSGITLGDVLLCG